MEGHRELLDDEFEGRIGLMFSRTIMCVVVLERSAT